MKVRYFIVVASLALVLLSTACFADGTFRVNVDVQPGTYRAINTSAGCYWERLSGFGGTFDEIIANNFTTATDVVTISPTDAGFSASGCGLWLSANFPLTSSPTAPFGAGTYIVGMDIAPGTWRNSDSSGGCYWARLKGFGGTFADLITNNYTSGLDIVTISASDAGFTSNGCGTWTKTN